MYCNMVETHASSMYLLKDEKNPLARVPTIVVGAAAVGSVPEGALGEEWRDHQPVDQPASQPAGAGE